jgi:hypothetical protein
MNLISLTQRDSKYYVPSTAIYPINDHSHHFFESLVPLLILTVSQTLKAGADTNHIAVYQVLLLHPLSSYNETSDLLCVFISLISVKVSFSKVFAYMFD